MNACDACHELTDAQSYVKAGPVKPDALGRYSFAGVQPGTYQLRLAAGELHDFWVDAPANGLQVVVPATATHLNLGTTCADTTPPERLEIKPYGAQRLLDAKGKKDLNDRIDLTIEE